MEQQPNSQNNIGDTIITIIETIILATLLIVFIRVFLGITGALIPIVVIALSFTIIKFIKQKIKDKKAGKNVVWVEKRSLIGFIFLILAFFAYSLANQSGLI